MRRGSIRRWAASFSVRLGLMILVGSGMLPAVGCGKKGPPLPPLRHGPERVTSLASRQRGKQILLAGTLPDKSQDGGPLVPLQEVRIFRLDRGGLAGPGLTGRTGQRNAMRQFTREAKTIATLSGEALGKAISGRRVRFIDADPFPGALPEQGQEFTYALTVVDSNKRSSPISQLVSVRMVPPPLPPSSLRSEISEKKIRLNWEPPSSEGKKQTLLYNLYRSEQEGDYPEKPRNEKPLSQPLFEDEEFTFGKTYYYVATSLIAEGTTTRESENSMPIQLSPADIYPPSVPVGLAVSAEHGVINLYWFPNSESDLGGYRIYRSEKEDEDFHVIGTVGGTESTFVDITAKAGVKYYYAISAVDQSSPPNESAHSEVRGDRLPPRQTPSGDKPQSRP